MRIVFDNEGTWNDTVKVAGLVLGSALAGATVYSFLRQKVSRVNGARCIDPNNPKVVHMVDVEDVAEKKAFCRCWRSGNFPYCDGSHNLHNKMTGDNVGPVVVKHKST